MVIIMKVNIKNVTKFAVLNNTERSTMQKRLTNGWKFGVLDGKYVMYQPKSAIEVIIPENAIVENKEIL